MEIKYFGFGEEELKLSLFANDTMAWIQNPKESTNKFLRLRRKITNVRGYKISIQKPIVFPYTNNEHHYTRN